MTSLPVDLRWPRAGHWLSASRTRSPRPERVDLAVIGVPAWRTSLSATRADTTPAAVREALLRYSTWSQSRDVDVSSLAVADLGDVDAPDGPDGEQRVVTAVAAAAGSARLTVALGGDNSVTVPVMLGMAGEAIDRAGLVTLDAHHDLRDGVSNGSPVRRLLAAGVAGHRVVQVGIADFANSREYAAVAREAGIHVVTRQEVRRRGIDDVMVEAIAVAGAAGGPVHVDLDVDVCDRAVAPACPASLPGGLAAHELLAAAAHAGAAPAVRSIDITEVDAAADAPDGRTVRLAALCLLEAAAALAARSSGA